MKTEFEFTLPTGYIDEHGQVHHQGVMRRSRAMDEILPMQDLRVQANPAYATVIILARVLVRLGNIAEVTPQIIETMFASDLSYLQTLYRQINSPEQLNLLEHGENSEPVTRLNEAHASDSVEPFDVGSNLEAIPATQRKPNASGDGTGSAALEPELAPV